MQMQKCKCKCRKRDNCQEMLYEGVKMQQVVRIATKEFVRMLPKGFGHPNQEINSVNMFQN